MRADGTHHRYVHPTRIDLAGGTIDIWPLYLFHEGASTLNAASACGLSERGRLASDNGSSVPVNTTRLTLAMPAHDLLGGCLIGARAPRHRQ